MKYAAGAAFLALRLLFPAQLAAQDISKPQFQNMYAEYLRRQGYAPEIEESGDVTFRVEGRVYVITVNENDPEYFSILFPNFQEIGSGQERVQVANACAEVNRSVKIAKAYITANSNTSITVGVLLPKPKDFQAVFPRMMTIHDSALRRFREEMRRQQNSG